VHFVIVRRSQKAIGLKAGECRALFIQPTANALLNLC
jgi:hypothetical protein